MGTSGRSLLYVGGILSCWNGESGVGFGFERFMLVASTKNPISKANWKRMANLSEAANRSERTNLVDQTSRARDWKPNSVCAGSLANRIDALSINVNKCEISSIRGVGERNSYVQRRYSERVGQRAPPMNFLNN